MELIEMLEPWMIPIVVMVCVTLIVAITTIGGVIKTSIKNKSGKNLSDNKEFLSALAEFKENMERRVANLEAIAADDTLSDNSSKKRSEAKAGGKNTVEIEMDDPHHESKTEANTRLRNMLNK